MSKQAVRHRRQKIEEGIPKPTPKDKFMQGVEDVETMQQQAVPKLEAKTYNQKVALSMFKDKRSVMFLTGSAGTGKSMLAAYEAAMQMKSKRVEKVFLVRPAVAVGKSVGLLPGSIEDKMTPYFAQTITHLEKFMGKPYLRYCLDHDLVLMKPAEYLRGMSFEDCVVIIEESQNFTREEFEMVLTRLGDNCTLIFTGDQKQHDLRGVSGLEQTLELLEKMIEDQPEYLSDEDLDELGYKIGIVRFTPEDVVRSGITKAFVNIYHNNM